MKARAAILAALATAAFAWIFSVHTAAVFSGADDMRMIDFIRRHGRAGAAGERLVERGPILDCNGATLSAAVPGERWARSCPLGEAGVHPVGVFGRNPTGCERVLDSVLSRPSPGDPSSGGSVRLSLDSSLQRAAYALLEGRRGAVVAIEPRSGRILAAASSPGWDPCGRPDARQVADGCFVNRAFDGLYPPGSVFKIFTAAAAIDRGLDPVYDCPAGGFSPEPGSPPVRDSEAAAWRRRGAVWKGFGRIGMEKAFAHSSNVYFAKLGCALGADAFDAAAEAMRLRGGFSLMERGGESLQARGAGIPRPHGDAELAAAAIGQGRLQLTPLCVALLTAAVACDGAVPAPTIDAEAPPRVLARAFKPATAEKVRKMMRAAAAGGTARGCDIPGTPVCAKTGTAQTGSGEDHAWFTCFAPCDDPAIVVTVLVENGGFGAKTAMPVARELLLKAERLGYFGREPRGTEDEP